MLAGCNVFRTIGTGALLSLRAGLSSSRGCQVFCFCRSDKHSSVGPVRRWFRSGKGPEIRTHLTSGRQAGQPIEFTTLLGSGAQSPWVTVLSLNDTGWGRTDGWAFPPPQHTLLGICVAGSARLAVGSGNQVKRVVTHPAADSPVRPVAIIRNPSPGRGTSGTLYVSLDSGQLERFWGEDITPKLFHHIATTSQRHQRSARPAPVDQYAPGGPGRQPCGMDLRRGAPLALASYLLGPVLALQLQGTPDANGPYVTGQFVDGIILPNQGGNGLDYRAVHSWR